MRLYGSIGCCAYRPALLGALLQLSGRLLGERASYAEVDAYYRSRYGGDHQQLVQNTANKACYKRQVDKLLSLTAEPKERATIVDYDSSYPMFALTAMQRGVRRAVAVDWDVQARLHGRERSLTCLNPHELELDIQAEEEDVLHFSHVIQHMTDSIRSPGAISIN